MNLETFIILSCLGKAHEPSMPWVVAQLRRLGIRIRRNAVWKALARLRDSGYITIAEGIFTPTTHGLTFVRRYQAILSQVFCVEEGSSPPLVTRMERESSQAPGEREEALWEELEEIWKWKGTKQARKAIFDRLLKAVQKGNLPTADRLREDFADLFGGLEHVPKSKMDRFEMAVTETGDLFSAFEKGE